MIQQSSRRVLLLSLVILAALLFSVSPRATTPAECASATVADADAVLIRLLQRMQERLGWMPEVARAKWNSGAAISDPAREQQLLDGLIPEGKRRGLQANATTTFFAAQMDGAKRLQEDCFARWHAENRGPFPRVADLKREIRPAIDRLNQELLDRLAAWHHHPAAKEIRPRDLERMSQQILIGPGITKAIRQQILQPLHGGQG